MPKNNDRHQILGSIISVPKRLVPVVYAAVGIPLFLLILWLANTLVSQYKYWNPPEVTPEQTRQMMGGGGANRSSIPSRK